MTRRQSCIECPETSLPEEIAFQYPGKQKSATDGGNYTTKTNFLSQLLKRNIR